MKLYAPTEQAVHIGLTTGHTIVIERDGTEVPPMFRREAIARGCLASQDEVPDTTADRTQLIRNALKAMLDGANEGDFTAEGKPNLRVLKSKCGFDVTREEADALFDEVSEAD